MTNQKLLSLNLFAFFMSATIFYIDVDGNYLQFFLIVLIIQYVIVISASLIKYNVYNSSNLFLYSFCLFLLPIPFLGIFDKTIVINLTKYANYNADIKDIMSVIFSISLFIFAYGLSVIIRKGGACKKNVELSKRSDKAFYLQKIALIIILSLSPFTILKLYNDFLIVKTHGYLYLYSDYQKSSFILRFSWYITKVLFPFLLITYLSKRQFFIVFVFFVVLNVFDFMKGSRGLILQPLFFFLWYYYIFISQKKPKVNNALLVGLSVFILSSIVLALRGDYSSISFDEIPVMLGLFFTSQGVSFYVNVYFMELKDVLINPSNFYILSPIYDFFLSFVTDVGRNVEYVSSTLSLDHKLTYSLAPGYYVNGNGLGSSIISETYALGGLITVFISGFFLHYIVHKIEEYVRSGSIIPILFSWFWIQALIWSPRGSILSFVLPFLICVCFYMIMSFLLNICRR
ncbi:O-antigen polysaccharide polymerase Wzy [Photobacterium nomapromontoriensis]|uniref:O-antigen polysaccharide polymerase Wzy n=1 Tax=Photobacterium nomapromontoriensis TaxID=2910237 RepID=UPI003D0A5B6F